MALSSHRSTVSTQTTRNPAAQRVCSVASQAASMTGSPAMGLCNRSAVRASPSTSRSRRGAVNVKAVVEAPTLKYEPNSKAKTGSVL
ncbi:hypothetical protein HaLaN_13199, partial [Haematococcus lacustris]